MKVAQLAGVHAPSRLPLRLPEAPFKSPPPANDGAVHTGTALSACRSCGGVAVSPVLDLGSMPLANALPLTPEADAEAPRFPLALQLCQGCGLVQLTHAVPPEMLFSEYVYFSSYSDTMLRHAEALATRMIATQGLGPDARVIEIASNDGYLLQYYRRVGVPVLGIEPAANVAAVAEAERGIPTVVEFFGAHLADALAARGIRADVLHAHNVLGHVPDLNGFVRGMARLLSDNGVAVVEVPHVVKLVDCCEFDTIYHEHHSYFSLTALVQLFGRNGMVVTDVERLAIHGGSLRIFAQREGDGRVPSASVAALLNEEDAWGVRSMARYKRFGARVARLRDEMRTMIATLRAEGHRVAAYGATAKGTVLLNYFGIGGDELEFVCDRSPHKQGRYVPGVLVPIVPPDTLLVEQPDYVLLLAWNLADEILGQQAEFRQRGGRFIVPVPDIEVIE